MGRPRKQRVTCSTPGCGRVERSNGLCSLCYGRAWRKAHRKTTEANPDAWQQTDMVFLAGLLDARGSFSHRDTGEGMTFGVRLDLLDRQLAERLAATLGVGNVGRVIKPRAKYKSVWRLSVHRRQHVRAVIMAVRPWLSATRRGHADELLAEMDRYEALKAARA
jgi:hypothetical protein